MSEIRPVKTQRLGPSPVDQQPLPTVEERLTVLSDALEAALDPATTDKAKADALANVRDVRKSRATDGKR